MCWLWFHKWGKWNLATVHRTLTSYSTLTSTKISDVDMQKRACEDCGLTQIKDLR